MFTWYCNWHDGIVPCLLRCLQCLQSLQHFLCEFGWQVFFWIIEHTRANAILAARALEHIHINATLASTPKSLVVGKVGEGYGMITQLGIHSHNGGSTGQGEYLGVRLSLIHI